MITRTLPFIVKAEINNGIEQNKYLIFLLFKNFSNARIIHGNRAKARISGLNTSRIEIDGGKKFIKMNVAKIVLFENSKYRNKK